MNSFDHQLEDANKLETEKVVATDIVVVGSGAGGANAARILSRNREVLLVEEGPYKKSSDFDPNEFNAYKDLYQEGAGRTTKDFGIKILQGRAVGGSALINWTTSFRTPLSTLSHWKKRYGINFVDQLDFDAVEKNYSISKWHMPPNPNNEKLKNACESMGWDWNIISRNVNGCANLGLCGLGCPINAKQSPIVASLPESLKNGARLIFNLKAIKLETGKDKIKELLCVSRSGKTRVKIQAKTFILASGAVGTPALMLRSKLKDPHNLIGKKTFLHPVSMSAAVYDEKIEGAKGAPQSVYSDHFLKRNPVKDPMGYKLETAPLYPVLYGTAFGEHGQAHEEIMRLRPYTAAHLALMRDGFHPDSSGGQVELDQHQDPVLDYKITPYVWKGLQEGMVNLVEAQLKSGAKKVWPMLAQSKYFSDFATAKDFILKTPLEPVKFPVVSAHVMGGCAIGADPKKSVLNLDGRHRHYENLYVMDGSVFPTSVGANPMETIFAFSDYLAKRL